MNIFAHEEARLRMSQTARSAGFAAIISSAIFFSIPFIPLGIGCFAILLAFLSKGYHSGFDANAKAGVILGTVAIVASLIIMGYSVYSVLMHPELYTETYDFINDYFTNLYGEDYVSPFSGYDLLGGVINGLK